MTRIAPSPMPGVEGDRLDRADRAERTPAGGPGTPFRAALRKADKMARAVDDSPPAQPQAQLPPQTQPGSIADVIAASTDDPGEAPGIAAVRAPGAAAASLQGATPEVTAPPDATANADATAPQDAAAPRAPAKVSDSPVTAWVAAAVTRAVGSFASGNGAASAKTASGAHLAPGANAGAANAMDATSSASTAGAANTATVMPAAALAAIGLDGALPALSPLEQAVHDLLGRATGRDDKDARDPAPDVAPGASAGSLQMFSAPMATDAAPRGHAPATVHAAQAAELPEPPTNPSHVHLVLDDGAERTVVTVAVRGSEVHVALRSSDDATGAALARNAASLDHAMRARGLQLGELTAESEPRDQRQPRDSEPRERRDPNAERFKLEEKP